MDGQLPWADEDDVDTDDVAPVGKAVAKHMGGVCHPHQPVSVDRKGKVDRPGAALHFDEGDGAATPGDQIDLAKGRADPPVQDSPAPQA